MRRKTIIHIAGPIATGKTTIARILRRRLSKNYRVKHIHFVGLSGPTYWFSLFLVLIRTRSLKIFTNLMRDRNTHPITVLDRNFVARFSFLISVIELLSIILLFFIKIYIPTRTTRKDILVIEEGIVNTLGGYLQLSRIYNLPHHFVIIFLMRLLSYLNKRNINIYIYLDSDDCELLKRWDQRHNFVFLNVIGVNHYIEFSNYIRVAKTICCRMMRLKLCKNLKLKNTQVEMYFGMQ